MTQGLYQVSAPMAPAQVRARTEAHRPAGAARPVLPWRRAAKYAAGVALLAVGALSTYQNVVVQTSREAVINGRVVAIRAPMDGIVRFAAASPGHPVAAAAAIGQIEDPHPDDARVFALQQEAQATGRERDALVQRVADLERARAAADAQAAAYQAGRVRQDQLRIEEAQAKLAAAKAREADAAATVQRGTALYQRGFQSEEAHQRARHSLDIAQNETLAVQKRLGALEVELAAARTGTYLGDNYNDVPSSFQRARELTVRIEETRATLDQLARKSETLAEQLTAEQRRLAARSIAALTAPVSGHLWTTSAVSGEFVRRGQDLLAVLDCATVTVTASVGDRIYNELRLGDPVRFRVAGTNREYFGSIAKLGSAASSGNLAITPAEGRNQLTINLPELARSADDRCAVGRTGEVVFESRGSGVATDVTGTAMRVFRALGRTLGIA
jgi:multidrug resistance efflux pump